MKRLFAGILTAALVVGISASAHAVKLKDMKLDVSGLLQTGIHSSETAGSDDELDIDRLRLRIRANPAEDVMFFTQLELTDHRSPNTFGSNVPPQSVLPDGTADNRIVDMYLVFTQLDWVTVLLGQMPTPVSYELNTDEYELETINYSSFVGLANRDRGAGLVFPISKEVKMIGWLLNGVGAIDGANNDLDDRNNFGAMLEWSPEPPFSMKLWTNQGDYKDNQGILGPAGDWIDRDVDAYGFGFNWERGGFHIFGEYALAETTDVNMGPLNTGNTLLRNQETDLYVLHFSYRIPETDFQLVARYDEYDPDNSAQNDDSEIVTAGINWDFEENARFQITYEFHDGLDDDNEIDALLSVRF